jgi:S1-C subfamily serine protease
VSGDLITAIDRQPVTTLESMLDQFERRQPGDAVTLQLWRDGAHIELRVRLGQSE